MTDPAKHTKARILIILGMVLLLPLAIGMQMIRIQLFEGNALRALWNAQALDVIPVPAQRGQILDARGRIMVSNTVTYSLGIDPLVPNTQPSHIAEILDTLSAYTGRPAATYRSRIQQAPRGSRYIMLERSISRPAYLAIKSLRYRNTILEEDYRRRYNYESLASHVLGYVNHEARGQMGLESQYERLLRGTDGEQQVQRDRMGRIRSMVGAPRRQPVNGYTLKTTIDAHIQAIAEEELREGVIRTRSAYGSVVIVDPRSGAVRAMANYPTFNPNDLRADESANRRNFAISDMIEPGSTFKLVTAVAAVEQQKVTLDEIFETPENGVRIIHGQAMRDHNPLGTLSFENAIKKSSNIATAEVAMRIPRETFFQYARNMGFGTPTGIDLSFEEAGRMQRPYQWSAVTLPWMSIGYEVQVTPLQMVMAYAAFANNGRLMRPYIVDEILDASGNVVEKQDPVTIRTAIQPETIAALMPAFEGVVTEDGTAQFASIEGITIGGKTGTAQKFIDGSYQTRYRASFIGFYPTDEPRYVVMVLLDEPRTSIFGGFVSGPIFRQITSRIMGLDEHLQREIVEEIDSAPLAHVPQLRGMSAEGAMQTLNELGVRYTTVGEGRIVTEQSPVAGPSAQTSLRVTLTLGEAPVLADENTVRSEVPELRGMSMRQAVLALTNAGYTVQQIGSGTVYAQFPAAGAVYGHGREVTIRGRARSMTTLATAQSGGQP